MKKDDVALKKVSFYLSPPNNPNNRINREPNQPLHELFTSPEH